MSKYSISYDSNFISDNELYHYGVPGMRWGRRKKQYGESAIVSNVRKTKAAYKSANKAYSKAYNKASSKSIAELSPFKKHRQANDARWKDVVKKAEAANKAEIAYKEAKRARKTAIKSTTNDVHKSASLVDKLMYNDATRRKAAKYIVDNDMPMTEAVKKAKGDAWRNSAALVTAVGGVTLAYLYKTR